ncbi:angiopoietin-related protein 7-like [Xenia sp. Carnegie-2017]|uniref:angiopoietin-related protein 7-like n=1 Tax=Xenia sp. Carnegie-2017 TaxID=2897299 RepID=UPI001F0448D1|nr:angiopoietin-related protein 7-like [Xenia sp. Carnegie-2017]
MRTFALLAIFVCVFLDGNVISQVYATSEPFTESTSKMIEKTCSPNMKCGFWNSKCRQRLLKLYIQKKTLEAQLAKTQNMLKTIEKHLTRLSKKCQKLTGIKQSSKEIQEKDCADLYKKGEKKNGVYQIDHDGQGYFKVFCDMTSSGGGWTVFQRRQDGSVNFYRGWKDYKQGFGDLKGEFWLGLEKIYRLTSARRNKLRVDLGDMSGKKTYAEYDYFAVKNENEKYQLSLAKYSDKSIGKYKQLKHKILKVNMIKIISSLS